MSRRAARGRIALYGAGMISRAHGAAASFGQVDVVAVASRTHAHAAERANELRSIAVTYDDIVSGRVDVDIVIVATPPQCHAHDVLRLLEAGKTVLVEKPLCRTLDEADAIVRATAQHGGQLLYGENLAHAPVVQQLLRRAPALGPLTNLEVRSLQGLPTWGEFTTDEWGGGALFDLGVHPLAVALLCARATGAGAAVAAEAVLEGGSGHGSDEHAELRLRFASGLVAGVTSSWKFGPEPLWDAQMAGANAVLRAELMPVPTLECNGEPVALPPTSAPLAAIERFGYLAQIQALITCASRRETPVMSAEFGRDVLDVVCASYLSAGRGGASVKLPFGGPRDRTPLQLWRGE
jgi:myo-inositol 2-dehydrogenase / D-chiro-inositol 1-dehydrogenase